MASYPELSEAISSWLTHMAQRGKAPLEIDRSMDMMWRVTDYLERQMLRYSSGNTSPYISVYDIATAHYGNYEIMIEEQRMDVGDVELLYNTVNGFLAFIANEYRVSPTLLRIIKDNVGKNRKGITEKHLNLVNVLRNMERKQRRNLLGVLMERHRELKETDDFIRRYWGDW
jgi:hypothetical protein